MNRRHGVADQRVGPQDSLQIDIDGLMGEFALAKLLNVYPDMQVGTRPLHDLMTSIGGVDVKTTRYKSGRLLANPKKATIPCDWYALMWLENDETVHFLGAASAEKLLADDKLKELNGRPAYLMDQDELISPTNFKYLVDAGF